MENDSEEFNSSEWLKNLPASSANESFAPEQLVACPQCARKNAPTRLKCLYCAADLPATELPESKQLSRRLESWEKGFNLIFLPGAANPSAENIRDAAKMLRLETEDLRKILEKGKTLPVACAESASAAEILVNSLKAKNFETVVLSDKKLAIEKFPQRLRAIEFAPEKLVLRLFNTNESVEIVRQDLSLIVAGALFERRIESTQKHQRKKESEITNTIELTSDELLIDVYGTDAGGYRIESDGFDFSCLGEEKKMLVRENMKTLAAKLQTFAPAAKFDADYNRLRAELGAVWQIEETRNSKGIQRRGFGKVNFETILTISNLKQFTRYSRMLKNLL